MSLLFNNTIISSAICRTSVSSSIFESSDSTTQFLEETGIPESGSQNTLDGESVGGSIDSTKAWDEHRAGLLVIVDATTGLEVQLVNRADGHLQKRPQVTGALAILDGVGSEVLHGLAISRK